MDKKQKIINTAVKLFVKQGFVNTPTSQISKEAGVASGTLFYHFNTKEEMISEAYAQIKQSMFKGISKGLTGKEGVKKSIRKIWYNLIKWGLNHKEENDFLQKFYNSAYVSKETLEQSYSLFKGIRKVIEKGIKERKLKNLDPDLIGNTCLALYNVFLAQFSQLKKVNKKQLSESFEVCWDAIKR